MTAESSTSVLWIPALRRKKSTAMETAAITTVVARAEVDIAAAVAATVEEGATEVAAIITMARK